MRNYIPNPEGRIPNPLRAKYQEKFHLSERQVRRLSDEDLVQLEGCYDDAARRVLIWGIGDRRKLKPEVVKEIQRGDKKSRKYSACS